MPRDHHEEVAHMAPVFFIFCGKTQGIAKENNHFNIPSSGAQLFYCQFNSVFVVWYPPSHKNRIEITLFELPQGGTSELKSEVGGELVYQK